MAETPEEAIAVMRQASEVVSSVLPSALADLVCDELLGNIDAVLRGSTPQLQWVAREVLALAEQQQTRSFKLGDEVRWRWHEDGGSGLWFKARLVEHHPADYPTGWAGAITDQGSFYGRGDDGWDCPVGHVVYMDEPSMTLVTEGGEQA